MTTRLLQIYLIVTSVLAIAAILEPTLVVVGLFLGILPGVVLQLAPAGFLYGLVFAIILQFAIPAAWRPGVRSLAAFTAILAVFWALPQPGLWYAQKLLNDSLRQDVTPAPDAPVELSGHVRISNPDASTHCHHLHRWPKVVGDISTCPRCRCGQPGDTYRVRVREGLSFAARSCQGPGLAG